MSVTSELVTQSVFTAAIFLVMISVPKLLIVTSWYAWRIHVFKNLGSLSKRKMLHRSLDAKTLSLVQKSTEKSGFTAKQIGIQIGNFTHEIRDPLIEAVVALLIIFSFVWVYPDISMWLVLASVGIVVVLVISASAVLSFPKQVSSCIVDAEEAEAKQKEVM